MRLYHYTSYEVLIAIGDYKKLRATHYQYLNDYKEFVDGLDVVKSVLQDQSEDLNKLVDRVDEFRDDYDVYIMSFSTEPDLLSQWRAYCPEQGGVSIGFDLFSIGPSFKGLVFQCLYDEVDKKVKIHKIIDDYERYYNSNIEEYFDRKPYSLPNSVKDYNQRLLMSTFLDLMLMAATFKDPGFKEESEYRIINMRPKEKIDKKVKFRVDGGLIKPYIEFDIEPGLLIEEIILGPNMDIEKNRYSLSKYMKIKDYNWNLINSKIPYRGW